MQCRSTSKTSQYKKSFQTPLETQQLNELQANPADKKQLDDYDDTIKSYLNLHYIRNDEEQLIRNYIKKRKRNI